MKATIRVTDLLDGKSMTIECSIHKDAEPAKELVRAVKANRKRIVSELRLSFGEASIELISYDRVIATGKMVNNVFAGGGKIEAKECIPQAA